MLSRSLYTINIDAAGTDEQNLFSETIYLYESILQRISFFETPRTAQPGPS